MSNKPTPPFPGDTPVADMGPRDLYTALLYHGAAVTLRTRDCGIQDVIWSTPSGVDGHRKWVVAQAYGITTRTVCDNWGRILAYPLTLADVVVTLGRYVTRRGFRTLGAPIEADRLLHLDAYDAPPPKVWTVDDRVAEVPPEVLHSFLRDAGFDVSLQPWARGQAVVWTKPMAGHTALQSRVVALWADNGPEVVLDRNGLRIDPFYRSGSTVRSLLDTLRRAVMADGQPRPRHNVKLTRVTLGGFDIPLPTAESVFGVPNKPEAPAPAAPVTFKVGDLVRLKSGGPVMTVTELGSTDDPTKFTYNRVYTTYFEGNVKHQLGSSHDCLVRA